MVKKDRGWGMPDMNGDKDEKETRGIFHPDAMSLDFHPTFKSE